MKAPNLEDLIAESESAHALTADLDLWDRLLGWMIPLRGTALPAYELRSAIRLSCPPAREHEEALESILGHLVGLYIERFGESEVYRADAIRTEYGEAPADTYFDLPKMLELLTDLQGDD